MYYPDEPEPAPLPQKRDGYGRFILYIFAYITIALMTIMLLVLGGAAAVIVTYSRDLPYLDPQLLHFPRTSVIYDMNDRELIRLHGEINCTPVQLQDIPEHVREAFIAIEDDRFYNHNGVNYLSLVRAAHINFRAGYILQGGSTITQQLVRMAYLSPEQTLKRKIQEILLAIRLEEIYSKNKILELYLNRVYFGSGAYGVEAATLTYFGKSISETNLSEAAMLAGIANSPNRNNPFNSTENALVRMNTVLNRMYRLGLLTNRETREAKQQKPEPAKPQNRDQLPYPYFLDYAVHHELIRILASENLYGGRREAYEALYNSGLKIYTTLDTSLQKKLEKIVNTSSYYPETIYLNMKSLLKDVKSNKGRIPAGYPGYYKDKKKGIPQPQAAVVVADPVTGIVPALVGGREYKKGRNEVLRYLSLRQPGSAMKPLVAFAPAINEGLVDEHSYLQDSAYTINNWTPQNWDYRHWGTISVRDALIYSRNVPAVKLFEELGFSRGTSYAEKMGITTFSDADRYSPAVVLGGVSGVKAWDMAQAYAVLANGGLKQPFYVIRRIEDNNGKTIYEYEEPAERVLKRETAEIITDILEETHRLFLGNQLFTDRPISAKTGTTDQNRDAYLAAYTNNTVVVLWMGYDYLWMGDIPRGHEYSLPLTKEILQETIAASE